MEGPRESPWRFIICLERYSSNLRVLGPAQGIHVLLGEQVHDEVDIGIQAIDVLAPSATDFLMIEWE